MSNFKKTSSKNLEANDIALNLIAFIASDEERMERFCALSGLGESELKQQLSDPAFLGFVFDYALQDEQLLLAFAAEHDIKPEKFLSLRRALPGAQDDF
jgi:Protein of unknown function (DUF3572)